MVIDTGDSVPKGSNQLLQSFYTIYADVWVSDTYHEVVDHKDTGY